MICTNCGAQLNDGVQFCAKCGTKVSAGIPAAPAAQTSSQGVNFDFNTNTATPTAGKKNYQYKVLSQKDKWFSGKFDPALLEQAINSYAQQGWRVIGCATADIAGFGATRQEFITLLEREV